MTLRLLHTADWQLGKPFAGFGDSFGALLAQARFDTLRRVAEIAREEAVDAVLVAGDVFERNDVATGTISRALAAMRPYSGPWLLLPGNHDAALAASVWTRLEALGRPDNVIACTRPDPVILADGRLAILPAPLTERRVMDDLTGWMDSAETPAGAVRVGLAHGSIEGRLPEAAESANPIAPDRAARAGLVYLALGDWHGTLEVGPAAWYAGTPEPDSFKQNDPGHILVVEIDGPERPPRVERRPVAQYAWRERRLDLSAMDGEAGIETALESLRQNLDTPQRTVLRLGLEGVAGLALLDRLHARLEAFGGELAHLVVDDEAVVAEPSAKELERLDDGGLLGDAVQTLLARMEAGGEEAETARLALRLLHGERARLEGA